MNAMRRNIYLQTILSICRIDAGLQIYVMCYLLFKILGNSLQGDKFQRLVKQQFKLREAHLLTKRNLAVDVTPYFADVLNSSQMVSGIKSAF